MTHLSEYFEKDIEYLHIIQYVCLCLQMQKKLCARRLQAGYPAVKEMERKLV